MSNDIPNAPLPHGDYERRDIKVSGVLYFLLGLGVSGIIIAFIVNGIFWFLNKRFEAEQKPISPLLPNTTTDTRRIPPQYGQDYQKYLREQFPAPQLEIDERTELNDIRLREENTLSTYGWVDKNAGTIHIPIDHAMDLLAQRGLPVHASGTEMAQSQPAKGTKK